MRSIIILLLLIISISSFAQQEYEFLRANEDKITSFQYLQHKKIFIAGTNNGKAIIADTAGFILKTHYFFKEPVFVYINKEETIAAFSGNDKIIRFCDLQTFEIYDSVFIPSAPSKMIHDVYFTPKGIYINSRTNQKYINTVYQYKYGLLKEVPDLISFNIFDYNPDKNEFILGQWVFTDKTRDDSKIKNLFKAKVYDLENKDFIHAHIKPINRAYYMDQGAIIISTSDMVRSTNVELGDLIRFTLKEVNSKTVLKLNDNTLAVVGTNQIVLIDVRNTVIFKRIHINDSLVVGNNESNILYLTNKLFYLRSLDNVVDYISLK